MVVSVSVVMVVVVVIVVVLVLAVTGLTSGASTRRYNLPDAGKRNTITARYLSLAAQHGSEENTA